MLNQKIETSEIIYYLKKNLQLKYIFTKILHQKIINNAVANNNIKITPEEVQAEGDRIRRQKHLEKAEDTFAWLTEELISSEDWEAGIYDELVAKKLAVHLFSEAVQTVFAQNQNQFEQVLLYELIIPDEELAWEIFYQIEEEEISFYQAAHLYNLDRERQLQCGYLGKVYRHDLKPNMATFVFEATPGVVMAPLPSEQGYHIFLVEEFIPAELTHELYQTLLNKMFQNWLARELDYMLFNKTEQ
jgi:parvulin-like peptidyl-prolyl isomerase